MTASVSSTRRSWLAPLYGAQTEGISNGYLSQIEGGQIRQPSPNVLYQLAQVYGLDYGDLLIRAGVRVPTTSGVSDA